MLTRESLLDARAGFRTCTFPPNFGIASLANQEFYVRSVSQAERMEFEKRLLNRQGKVKEEGNRYLKTWAMQMVQVNHLGQPFWPEGPEGVGQIDQLDVRIVESIAKECLKSLGMTKADVEEEEKN